MNVLLHMFVLMLFPECQAATLYQNQRKDEQRGKKSWQNSGDKAAAITKLYIVFFGIKFGDLKLPILLKTYSKTHHLLLFTTIII